MRAGYILDAGVLQGLAREAAAGDGPVHEAIPRNAGRLVTIAEVLVECLDVPAEVIDAAGILVEVARRPVGLDRALEAFSGGEREVWWRIDALPRADRFVVAHAIAERLDILTTDRRMKERSYREFLQRIDRLRDANLRGWYLPEIEVVHRAIH